MRRQFSVSRFGIALAAISVAILGTAVAAPQAVTSPVEGVVVISGQVFAGGEVALSSSDPGNLAIVTVDGRRVATAFRQALDRVPHGVAAELAFRTDERGRQQLVGVRWTSPDGQRTEERLLRFAAVNSTESVLAAASL
jgi:hypothetical protein